MGINITVLIQIVHFMIAYVLLERFFLRDAARLILGQDSRVAHKRSTISQASNVAQQLSQHVATTWRTHQTELQELAPALDATEAQAPTQALKPVVMGREQERQVIDALKSALIKRVLYESP